MANKPFVLNKMGFRKEVLNSDFMLNYVASTAFEISAKAGDGYKVKYNHGKKRALGLVEAVTDEAVKDNNENNTLQKAAYPLQVVNGK